MSEHTPTPWFLWADGDRPGIEAQEGRTVVLYGDEGDEAGVRGSTAEEALANAEFIVRAVNAHDDLVAALKEAISELNEWCEEESGEGYNNPRFNEILANAGAVL